MSALDELLKKRLTKISRVFDIDELISQPGDNQAIKSYYKTNKNNYRLFYNLSGFFHMGISHDGAYKHSDFYEIDRIVNAYIKETGSTKVLELAAGLGSNSGYLAPLNPNVSFTSIDLSIKPLKKHRRHQNYRYGLGDYHDLSQFDSESFDIVFVIEALCYSIQKDKVFNEVKRVLKPGGLFIIIDGYAAKRPEEQTSDEQIAQKLLEKGMALEKFEHIADVEEKIGQSGFTTIRREDYSKHILPSIKYLEFLSRGFFHFPKLARVLTRILSENATKNGVSGYMFPIVMGMGTDVYIMHVLKKP
jgi:sterol 24-C-methyltransferase